MSICISHKENLVKLNLEYFTAMVRVPEEYGVRQELVLFSQSWWQSEGWHRDALARQGELWDGVWFAGCCWGAQGDSRAGISFAK